MNYSTFSKIIYIDTTINLSICLLKGLKVNTEGVYEPEV